MMKRIDYLTIFLFNLVILIALALIQDVPGYMDADYYFAGGINLVSGQGFQDQFLWNYLDEPTGVSHPSHTYWMPMPSIIAAVGMSLIGKTDYFAARWIFLIMASLIPLIATKFGHEFTRNRIGGWIAGGLATFSGFYLIYIGLVETFALTMLLGSTWLLIARNQPQSLRKYLVLGIIAGLMHLTRADGILWLLFTIGLVIIGIKPSSTGKFRSHFMKVVAALSGYMLLTGLWYIRNWNAFNSLFPPGNNRSLWLLEYDQMFTFTAGGLTADRYLSSGAGVLLGQRWDAVLANLQTILAVEGLVFLFPLVITGWWRMRSEVTVRLVTLIWICIFLLMTIVFPLAGSRGGFFHASAALQPLIWGLCPVGLVVLIEWGIKMRSWRLERALPGFGIMVVFIAACISAGLIWVRVNGYNENEILWRQSWESYQAVEAELVKLGAVNGDIVMVNNPPGYYVATGRSAIVIPYGDERVAITAARTFGADYLILDPNVVKGLVPVYTNPVDFPGMDYLKSISSFQVFKFVP